MDKKVTRVIYNWFYCEAGQEDSFAELSQDNVLNMTYHEPAGPGDQHYVDIHFIDGETIRVFNLNTVTFANK